MGLSTLVELSNHFGADPDWVLAGGGNTSFKDSDHLYIKASGTQLATITADGFAKMDRSKLAAVWDKSYPTETAARERQALADLMDARMPGEEQKRPSVETLMHDLFPYAYVLHTHPARINGLTCGKDGKPRCLEIFPDALWIPIVNPGYVLATVIRDAADTYAKARGEFPAVVFLENHGLVVAGDDPDATKRAKENVMETVKRHLEREPDLSESGASVPDSIIQPIAEAFRDATGESWHFEPVTSREVMRLVESEERFHPVSGPFSPDHVVYSGHKPLFVTKDHVVSGFPSVLDAYQRNENTLPKTVAIEGVGALGCGSTQKLARSARALFIDAVKIAAYSESFGGPQFLPPDQIDFIRGWEVEKYRERVSRE